MTKKLSHYRLCETFIAIQLSNYRTVKVLFEEAKEIQGKVYMIGHTREYVKVAVETEQALTNEIVDVTVQGFLKDDILTGNFLENI